MCWSRDSTNMFYYYYYYYSTLLLGTATFMSMINALSYLYRFILCPLPPTLLLFPFSTPLITDFNKGSAIIVQ